MSLRVPLINIWCGLWVFVLLEALGMAQSPPNSPKPMDKPLDYIVERLGSVRGKNLPADFFGDRFQFVAPRADATDTLQPLGITPIDSCAFHLMFLRHVEIATRKDAFTTVFSSIDVLVRLKDAELGGVRVDVDRVALRMMVAAPVNLTVVIGHLSNDGVPDAKPTKLEEDLQKVSVPAEDAESAARLGRALEEQIQVCGGKRDPYAQPPSRGRTSVGAQRKVE